MADLSLMKGAAMDRLQPSDLLVVLELIALENASASVRHVASELDIPASTVGEAFRRLASAGILRPAEGEKGRAINKLALRDCIIHGVRWIAPAKIGRVARGVPTAHATPPISNRVLSDQEALVIACRNGALRGRSVSPIHSKVPRACLRNERMHQLVALVDVFRVGRARDREVATKELNQWV